MFFHTKIITQYAISCDNIDHFAAYSVSQEFDCDAKVDLCMSTTHGSMFQQTKPTDCVLLLSLM